MYIKDALKGADILTDHQHKDSAINGKFLSLCLFFLFFNKLVIHFLQ